MPEEQNVTPTVISLTDEQVRGLIREILGAEIAEQREENRRLADELRAAQRSQVMAPPIPGIDLRASIASGRTPGLLLARTVLAVAGSGRTLAGAQEFAKKHFGKAGEAQLEPVLRSLQAGDITAGGVLIDSDVSTDITDLLRSATLVRRLGARVRPMPKGNVSLRRQTSSAVASYVGEGKSPTPSKPGYGFLNLSAKKLVAMIPISNDLIDYATSMDVQGDVIRDARAVLRRKEDISFIRGTGTDYTPKSIKQFIPAAGQFPISGSAYTNVIQDLAKLVNYLREQDSMFESPGWMFSPRTRTFLETLITTDGQWVFRDEMMAGKLLTFAFGDSTQIPTNLGNDGDESEIYLADFDDARIGDTGIVKLKIATEGSYVDEDDATQSALQNDETVIRIEEQHDFGMIRDTAAILTGVTWGAPA